MKFKSKNLLVTGGAGFIGSNFIKYILDKYDDINIINLDKLTYAGNIKNTTNFLNDKRYKLIKGDICNKNLLIEIFKKYDIDGVINFAAESHVDNSILNPTKFIETNVNGVFNLLKTCYKYWMNSPNSVKKKYANARYHQISTDEVFGSIEKGSFSENCKYLPNSPYSSSKASADLLVRSFNKTYGLNVSTSICSNNYGLNQHLEKFIPKTINSILKNENIIVYGDGLNVRDWIHVLDHCSAIDIIFNKAKNGAIYNVASNFELTNLELVSILGELCKKVPKIQFVKDRAGHDRRYSLNITKIKKDFNWKTNYNFNDGINKIISEYE